MGVLETRQGNGTYVTSLEASLLLAPMSFMVDMHAASDSSHLQAVRRILETEAASRAANASLQVLGGYGYLRDYPVERIVRDVRLMEIGEGTSEIQRIVIARDLVAAS